VCPYDRFYIMSGYINDGSMNRKYAGEAILTVVMHFSDVVLYGGCEAPVDHKIVVYGGGV